jgi:2-keto-4-pentenoate hydratase/2-oxohepta-3-ene-1,7-dioic acid hydratase in catechol pathway
MRLATAIIDGRPEGVVIHADGAATRVGMTLQALIESGDAGLAAARAAAARPADIPADAVRLGPPLPQPRKNIFCVGRNYSEHIAEGARAQNIAISATEVPVFFTKPPTAICGPGDEVPIFPHVSTKVDYEVELAVVIGTPGRDIPADRALTHVFGYMILNDVTARDVQRRHGNQWFKGKGLDGSAPTGPWIVTADEIADPMALGIRLSVNGELRQDGNTRDMIFDIPTLIASLSQGLTLEPGDIIATGTPSGVGYAMEPPRFLAHGDRVVCEIDGIGRLENSMRDTSLAAQVA